ncbi:MAG: FxsA family protein [Rhodospirillales bacterium]|nr:FxsA family protein [Rhodospirillales bacterium]
MGWLTIGAILLVPLIEIAVFIQVAGLIGLGSAILLAIGAGVAGIWLVRRQGFSVLSRAQASIERGEAPVAEVFDGLCLLIAGGLLLLPGLVSDVFAILLLVPALRAWLRIWLGRQAKARHEVVVTEGRRTTTIVEGDFRVLDEDERR